MSEIACLFCRKDDAIDYTQCRACFRSGECSDSGRFIVHADQELAAFLELESAIQTDRHNHEWIARNRMKNWEIVADNLHQSRL